MLWIGLILGFCVGVLFVTVCYMPLVDRVNEISETAAAYKASLKAAQEALETRERALYWMRADIKQLAHIVPPDVYARFFDSPYKQN